MLAALAPASGLLYVDPALDARLRGADPLRQNGPSRRARASTTAWLTPSLQTLTLPKPLVEFGNKRMILHQIEALAAAGVTDIVLAVNYRPEIMEKYLKEVGAFPLLWP